MPGNDQININLRQRVVDAQKELRKLSDEQLMRMDESLFSDPDKIQDPALMAASYNEVRRRFVAAGWIWKRLFKREEYEKWVQYNKKMEIRATQQLIGIMEKRDDERSHEVE